MVVAAAAAFCVAVVRTMAAADAMEFATCVVVVVHVVPAQVAIGFAASAAVAVRPMTDVHLVGVVGVVEAGVDSKHVAVVVAVDDAAVAAADSAAVAIVSAAAVEIVAPAAAVAVVAAVVA